MSQEELGVILGVSKSAIQKYESGRVNELRADKIRLLCETFDVFPRYFIYEEDEFWRTFYARNQSIKLPGFIMDEDDSVRLMQGKKEIELLRLMADITQLNSEGFRRVKDYANDLARLEEYRITKKGSDA